jgi:hypothetical protein
MEDFFDENYSLKKIKKVSNIEEAREKIEVDLRILLY